MNLWFRLIWYLVSSRFRDELSLPESTSSLHFRVWPFDLDTSLHLNNGRYLTLMDLGRFDIIVAGGLLNAALRYKWTPIANAIVIRFRRELRLFDRFELRSRIVAWREMDVMIEQVFIVASGRRKGQVAARALFVGGLYDRQAKSFVEMARLMNEIGVSTQSPPMPEEAVQFIESVERLRDVDQVS